MMSNKSKILASLVMIPTLFLGNPAKVVAAEKPANQEEVILFKIHDIIPEKNADGKVLYCNIGATFYNRTKNDLANISMNLSWEDEVITEVIEQEERSMREQQRMNPQAKSSRYPTSALNTATVTMSLKLPPIKVDQQVSLKAKVSTDRCFILLNDMDINVTNCGTVAENLKGSRDCSNIFRYISPKMPEYYQDFKEKSQEEELVEADAHTREIENQLDKNYEEALLAIRDITKDKVEPSPSDSTKETQNED